MRIQPFRLALAGVLFAGSAFGQSLSANEVLPGCRDVIRGRSDPAQGEAALVKGGVCMGFLEAMRDMAALAEAKSRACVPPEVINGQVATVVVRYVDSRPAQWHEPFSGLVLAALHEAWPCR